MKVLFMAPLPPPITGHSLVSEKLLEGLQQSHEISVVDLSIGSLHDGTISFRRAIEVAKLLSEVRSKRNQADVAYLTIAESAAGNAKDLLIYLASGGLLRRTVIHLHGGSIGRLLFDRFPLIKSINRHFTRQLAGVILSGASHADIFRGLVDAERTHYVPNFAPEDLFVDEAVIERKFQSPDSIRVLFISGMDPAKGYEDLVEAYRLLEEPQRSKIKIDFAGRFTLDSDRTRFLEAISPFPSLQYHGIVTNQAKRDLFGNAHVFCLPTAMFEGQPISILEAYASGCAVLTTAQPGILDIFADKINGYFVEPQSPASIAHVLSGAIGEMDKLQAIAHANRRAAEQNFRAERFTAKVNNILEEAARTTVSDDR